MKKKSEPLLKDGAYTVQCEECGTKEGYQVKFVRGEPQNVAFIGHWDGWQPFGAPAQHSRGKLLFKITVCMYCTRDFLIQFYNISTMVNCCGITVSQSEI